MKITLEPFKRSGQSSQTSEVQRQPTFEESLKSHTRHVYTEQQAEFGMVLEPIPSPLIAEQVHNSSHLASHRSGPFPGTAQGSILRSLQISASVTGSHLWIKNKKPLKSGEARPPVVCSGPSSAEYSPMKILDHTGGKTSLENKNCGTSLRQMKVLVPDLLHFHKSSSQKRQNSAADASSSSFLVSHAPSHNMGFVAQFLTWRKERRKVIYFHSATKNLR
ncbi:uncharacterized protein LOC111925126 [Cyanistes caeruleus]|uniref:uncharacterized protein LOC111925126 n=1 Tax=Cyanistes caeruleus TaxID=156563 RepID=UPI000CDAE764|nr:uncharacterized protein LOC111925126 [Cyanistes caeruleus]